jgi:hypothetical protein
MSCMTCGINNGIIKKGKHNRSLKVAVQGLEFMAHALYMPYVWLFVIELSLYRIDFVLG